LLLAFAKQLTQGCLGGGIGKLDDLELLIDHFESTFSAPSPDAQVAGDFSAATSALVLDELIPVGCLSSFSHVDNDMVQHFAFVDDDSPSEGGGVALGPGGCSSEWCAKGEIPLLGDELGGLVALGPEGCSSEWCASGEIPVRGGNEVSSAVDSPSGGGGGCSSVWCASGEIPLLGGDEADDSPSVGGGGTLQVHDKHVQKVALCDVTNSLVSEVTCSYGQAPGADGGAALAPVMSIEGVCSTLAVLRSTGIQRLNSGLHTLKKKKAEAALREYVTSLEHTIGSMVEAWVIRVMQADFRVVIEAAGGRFRPCWIRQKAELAVAVAKLDLPDLQQRHVMEMIDVQLAPRLQHFAGPDSPLHEFAMSLDKEDIQVQSSVSYGNVIGAASDACHVCAQEEDKKEVVAVPLLGSCSQSDGGEFISRDLQSESHSLGDEVTSPYNAVYSDGLLASSPGAPMHASNDQIQNMSPSMKSKAEEELAESERAQALASQVHSVAQDQRFDRANLANRTFEPLAAACNGMQACHGMQVDVNRTVDADVDVWSNESLIKIDRMKKN